MTKRARATAARTMVTTMRVVGNKEGKGSKGSGNDDKGGGRAMPMATKRAMAMAMRVAGNQRQWQHRGQCQRQQGWWAMYRAMAKVATAMATVTKVPGK